MGIVPGNVIPAVERYIISDPLAINFMIFHEIYQVLSKTASPRSPQIFRVNPVPSMPNPVSLDFQVYSRASSGQKSDHLRIQSEPGPIGTKLRSPQKSFRDPVSSGPDSVSLDFQVLFPGAIGTKPRSPQKKIRIPAPSGTDIVSLDFQAYSNGPSGPNSDHLRIQSEPGPIGTKYC